MSSASSPILSSFALLFSSIPKSKKQLEKESKDVNAQSINSVAKTSLKPQETKKRKPLTQCKTTTQTGSIKTILINQTTGQTAQIANSLPKPSNSEFKNKKRVHFAPIFKAPPPPQKEQVQSQSSSDNESSINWNGAGRLLWGGGKYEGEINSGVQEGFGRKYQNIKLNDKLYEVLVYEGYWSYGFYEGEGHWKQTIENGILRNKFVPAGVLYYPENGICKYRGGFFVGLYHFYGESYDLQGNLEYEGEWKYGLYHGKGRRFYSYGFHAGYWIEGKKEGFGIFIHQKIQDLRRPYRYEGYFKKDKKEGPGKWFNGRGQLLYEVKYSNDVAVSEEGLIIDSHGNVLQR